MNGRAGAPAPATVVPLLQQAWTALQQGRAAAARDAAHAAIQQAPETFDAWRMLGIAEQGLGNAAGCREALLRAHALRPADVPTAFELGTLLLQLGDPQGARPRLRQAMEGLPSDARAAFRYGTASYLLDDMEAATEGFDAASQRDPDWVEAWNNLAAALGQRRLYPAAISAARQAVRLQPDAAQAHHSLAALLSNLSERAALREGLEAAEQALRLDPALADAHRVAAIVLRKLDEPLRAERHAFEALRLAPADVANVDVLGELLLANGKSSEAVDTYQAALGRGLDTPVLRRQHGIALLQAGQARHALTTLTEALARAGSDQRTIAHLGVATAQELGARAASQLWGLQRHVHRIALSPPESFSDVAAFHVALAGDIRRHSQQRWEPAGLAARKAYLSGDLLADRSAAIIGFEQRLREAIDGFIAQSRRDPGDVFLRNLPDEYVLHVWATQAAESGYIDTHIHEESWLSGAYYVELPDAIGPDDPNHAGWIEFGRPYSHMSVPDEALRLECPRVGDLLLFPSYLFHRTLPYRGTGERISISFDLAAA